MTVIRNPAAFHAAAWLLGARAHSALLEADGQREHARRLEEAAAALLPVLQRHIGVRALAHAFREIDGMLPEFLSALPSTSGKLRAFPLPPLTGEAAPVYQSSIPSAGTRLHAGAPAPEESGWEGIDASQNDTLPPVPGAPRAPGTAKRRAFPRPFPAPRGKA